MRSRTAFADVSKPLLKDRAIELKAMRDQARPRHTGPRVLDRLWPNITLRGRGCACDNLELLIDIVERRNPLLAVGMRPPTRQGDEMGAADEHVETIVVKAHPQLVADQA